MHHEVIVFLASLALLLGAARIAGEACRKAGFPAVAGEILAGIVIGKTVIGRIYPEGFAWLFPPGNAEVLLKGYTTVAVVLLLVVAGIEVDLSVVRKSGRSVVLTSMFGALFPFVLGFGSGFFLFEDDPAHPSRRVLRAVFFGIALAISALPVIARTLLDLGLMRSQIGLLILSAAVIDDLMGWVAFSVLARSFAATDVEGIGGIARSVALTLVFVVTTLVVVRPIVDWLLSRMQPTTDTEAQTGRVLSMVMIVALVGAAITEALGMHAVFGGFIMGLAIGDSKRLREHTRHVLEEFVTSVFTPVFFASMALRLDFAASFDLKLTAIVVLIAFIAKLVGASAGARLSGIGWREAIAIGFGMNSRGAMEILLAKLALDAQIVGPQMFVALVIMAIVTSLASGPALARLLRATASPLADLLRKSGVTLFHVPAAGPAEVITQMAEALARRTGAPSLGELYAKRVLEREELSSTGVGEGVAFPHAEVEGLTQPLLAFASTSEGLDFDAPDGERVRLVLMLLTPPREYERELQLLASMARLLCREEVRRGLLSATSERDVLNTLEAADRSRSGAGSSGAAKP